jgi:Cd2+/Zn2+-exporting ATPase
LELGSVLPFKQTVFFALSVAGTLPVAWSALRALLKRELTVDLLASIALLFALLAKEWHSATFILLMITFARIFDLWTEGRARRMVEELFKYRPSKARIKVEDGVRDVAVEDLRRGNVVIVESGDRIPVDGAVISGQASVNEATLTGESAPVLKKIGDKVWSSTLAETGSLLVVAERVGEDSTLARIAALIDEASRKKAKTERIAAKFTGWYIALALAGSALLYVFSGDLKIVLATLLVVCADDIAVAVPLAYSAGIAKGAQRGILIKGSDVLEKLPKIRVFVTDKTGTLTFGKPQIARVRAFGKIGERRFLELLGMAEMNSKHPMSVAIGSYLKDRGIAPPAPDEFEESPGYGIMAARDSQKVFAGKAEYLRKNNIEIDAVSADEMRKEKEQGFTVTAVGSGGVLIGFVAAEDAIRPFAGKMIAATQGMGVQRWVMLTGDNEVVAKRVAAGLGVKSFVANMKPEDKLSEVEKIKKRQRDIVAMIGDGVNDAAALALADVSVAMGAIGSDAAIEAADVALMKDDLRRVPEAMLLGRKVKGVIAENFGLWAITNAVGLVLVFTGALTPSGAATYNFLTDFLPIFNVLRIMAIPSSGRGSDLL